jgi:hypothetical protein
MKGNAMRNEKRLARVELKINVVVDYEIEEGDSSVGIGPCTIINRIYMDRLTPTQYGLEMKVETLDIPLKFIDDVEREELEDHLLYEFQCAEDA